MKSIELHVGETYLSGLELSHYYHIGDECIIIKIVQDLVYYYNKRSQSESSFTIGSNFHKSFTHKNYSPEIY